MYEIREEKKKIRSKCRLLRADIEKMNKSELDARICEAFTSLVSYRYADTLLAYYPAKGEIDVRPVIERLSRRAKGLPSPSAMRRKARWTSSI